MLSHSKGNREKTLAWSVTRTKDKSFLSEEFSVDLTLFVRLHLIYMKSSIITLWTCLWLFVVLFRNEETFNSVWSWARFIRVTSHSSNKRPMLNKIKKWDLGQTVWINPVGKCVVVALCSVIIWRFIFIIDVENNSPLRFKVVFFKKLRPNEIADCFLNTSICAEIYHYLLLFYFTYTNIVSRLIINLRRSRSKDGNVIWDFSDKKAFAFCGFYTSCICGLLSEQFQIT